MTSKAVAWPLLLKIEEMRVLGRLGQKWSGWHMPLLHHRHFLVLLLLYFHLDFYYTKSLLWFLILIETETVIQNTQEEIYENT